MPDNIMLNYIELSNSDFDFTIYRKSYDSNKKEEGYFIYTLPTVNNNDADRYAVTFVENDECMAFICNSHDNIDLTKQWLMHLIIDKAKEITDVIPYSIKNDFAKNISFVIEELSQGERIIRLEPYFLEKNNTFGFLIDYEFRPFEQYKRSRIEKILSLSMNEDGFKNKNFYSDKLRYVSSFINLYMKTIFPIGDDNNTIDIKGNMTELESFLLNEKTYIFRNGDSNIQFQGIRDQKPLEAISKKPLFVFIFEKNKINAARQLVKALRGDSYSTFSGMKNMFEVDFDNDSIESIIVDNFSKESLVKIEDGLNDIIENNSESQIVGVFAGIAKDFDDENGYSPYYTIKSFFLKRGLAVQAVTIEQSMKKDGLKWSVSGIGLQLFVKLGGKPWKVKPCNKDCLIFGISSAHIRDENGKIKKYFAYSLCFDSSGIYKKIDILGSSDDRKSYITQLSKQIKSQLSEEVTDKIKKCVIHIPYKLRKDEIKCIKKSVAELKNNRSDIEFVFIKINIKNKFFGYSHYNSCVPLAGTCIPLGKKDFLVWFEGLQQGKTQVVATQNITNPVHIQFIDADNLDDKKIRSYIQDILNLSGANWRGFNAKHEPVTTLYPELIARFAGNFERYGINLDIGTDAMDKVWFI